MVLDCAAKGNLMFVASANLRGHHSGGIEGVFAGLLQDVLMGRLS
jgi:hypothetical protein